MFMHRFWVPSEMPSSSATVSYTHLDVYKRQEKMEEQKPEKKTSLLRKLDEKKKECAERDTKQQAVKKKRNHEMSL